MDRNLARPGTEAENEKAQDIALAMVDAMPLDITAPMAVGVVGILLHSTFSRCIKEEYRLAAFDDFAKHCRALIEKECRNAEVLQ